RAGAKWFTACASEHARRDPIPARRDGGEIQCRVRFRGYEPKPRADEPEPDDDGRLLHRAATPGLLLVYGTYVPFQDATALAVLGENSIFDRGPPWRGLSVPRAARAVYRSNHSKVQTAHRQGEFGLSALD